MSRDPLAALRDALARSFGERRIAVNAPLAPLTTFRVGGPADLLFEPRLGDELVSALMLARQTGVAVTMLGGGSNVLIADAGIRGLVIRPRGGSIVEEATGRVRADAAVTLNGLVRWTIGRGLAGLEAWAGTPGTVGGGVYGNAHWAGRLLGEHIESVRLWPPAGAMVDVPSAEMAFGYDASRLQQSGEVVISALFALGRGEPDALRAVARRSLAIRKATQPLDTPSAGCIFQNPDASERVPEGIPHSAGALVDRAGLKGERVGAAIVSPTHGNFIVNAGGATAADIVALIERCRDSVRVRFGVELRDEIVRIGEFGSPGHRVESNGTRDRESGG
jgi:UDP-N-acetylmuramate dehydrogenase